MGLQPMQQPQEPLNDRQQGGRRSSSRADGAATAASAASGRRGMRLVRMMVAAALAGTFMQAAAVVEATPLQEGTGLKRFPPWHRQDAPAEQPQVAAEHPQQQKPQHPLALVPPEQLEPLARQVDLLRFLLKNREALERQHEEEEEEEDDSNVDVGEEAMRLTKEEARRWIMLQRQRKEEELRRLQQQQAGEVEDGGRPKRRGGCLFHAGLAHNCDYRDVVGAVNEASHWGSAMAPGKRRRR